MPAQPLRHAESQARSLRDRLRVGEVEPIADIVKVIESAGVPVFLTALPGHIAGLANRANGRWYVVGDTIRGPVGRLRFTLAHEFGHVAMGHSPSVDDPSTLRMSTDASPTEEVDANIFAAEFLIPRNAIYDRVVDDDALGATPEDHAAFAERVAVEFGTTPWVPLYRLRTLDMLTQMQVAAVESLLKKRDAPADARVDDAATFAGTGATRLPVAHVARLARLAAIDDEADEG